MIPVPVVSPIVAILFLLGPVALVVVMIWSVRLMLSSGARAAFRGHPWLSGTGWTALALVGAFWLTIVISARRARHAVEVAERARHQTLRTAVSVGEIILPAGSEITTRVAGDVATFAQARVPLGTRVYGLSVSQIDRTIPYALEGIPRATETRLTLTAPAALEGWMCGTAVEFVLHTDGTRQFARCTLAAGNRAGVWEIPRGATVSVLPTDSAATAHAERWLVSVDDSLRPMQLMGASLSTVRIYLDASRRVLRLWDGELAAAFDFGPLRHGVGTRVNEVTPPLSGRHPGALLFTPANGQTLRYPGHPDIAAGMTVVQARDGRVLAVLPTSATGVGEFTTIIVDPDRLR